MTFKLTYLRAALIMAFICLIAFLLTSCMGERKCPDDGMSGYHQTIVKHIPKPARRVSY